MAEEKGNVILAAMDIRKSYGDFRALDGVSFTIDEGEFVSIIGPNGAGKTTLINVLTGLVTPNTGHVVFKGTEITGIGPEKLSKMGMARSFQLVNIFPNFSVLEFLMVAVVSRLGKGPDCSPLSCVIARSPTGRWRWHTSLDWMRRRIC